MDRPESPADAAADEDESEAGAAVPQESRSSTVIRTAWADPSTSGPMSTSGEALGNTALLEEKLQERNATEAIAALAALAAAATINAPAPCPELLKN